MCNNKKLRKNTSFKLSNISFKHWFCWSIRFLPETRTMVHFHTTCQRDNHWAILVSQFQSAAGQRQRPGRCSSYLPPNHPCLVYLSYIYGWFLIVTTVGFPKHSKKVNKKNQSSGYQDTILPTWNVFEQVHSLKLTGLRLKQMESPKKLYSLPSIYYFETNYASWWFQPIWKILVKMGIFPK